MGNDLTKRVTGEAVAAAEPTIGQRIIAAESEFQRAMPRGREATQLVRDALTLLRTTKNLAKCDQWSVLGGLMTFAQLGLRPGVLGHGWLIPFWSAKERCHQAQLVIGYKGYAELAYRTGAVTGLIGRAVHEGDLLNVEYGLDERLVHKPNLTDPGEPIGYYAVAKFGGGDRSFWYLTKAEAEAHRDRFAMSRDYEWSTDAQGRSKRGALKLRPDGSPVITGPWRDHFDSMAIKTAFLRLATWMPKSPELAAAMEADETVRTNIAASPDAMLQGTRPELPAADEPDSPEPGESADHGEVTP